MRLEEQIAALVAYPGYVYHRLRATDHVGMVKCYTFWMSLNGEMCDREIRVLVIDEGQPTENALVYSTQNIEMPSTAFRDLVKSKVIQLMQAKPEIEKVVAEQVSEVDEMAILRAYIYDSETDLSEGKRVLAFKDGTQIRFRFLVDGEASKP